MAAVEKATQLWRESVKYREEGNDRFFNYALSLRSAGLSLKDIELRLRAEATFGNSPNERAAQIPWIMSTLKRLFRKSRDFRRESCFMGTSTLRNQETNTAQFTA